MGESFFPQAQIKLRSSRTKTEICNGYDDDNWRKRRLTSWIWLSKVPAAAPVPADGNDGDGGAAGGGDGCCCYYSTELCRNGLFR